LNPLHVLRVGAIWLIINEPFIVQEEHVGGECTAVVVWFDVEFSQRFCKEHPVTLTTSPFSKQTHWAQTVLPLK